MFALERRRCPHLSTSWGPKSFFPGGRGTKPAKPQEWSGVTPRAWIGIVAVADVSGADLHRMRGGGDPMCLNGIVIRK